MSVLTHHIRRLKTQRTLPKRYCLPLGEWIKLREECFAFDVRHGFISLVAEIPERNFIFFGIPCVPLVVI